MDKTQRTSFFIILAIGIIYFAAMIPFTLSGAETPEMLEVFEVDEYAQYPHLIRMLTQGETFYQTIRNFVIYLHYFYGYPFYFWSALAVLPLKLFSSTWPADTRLIVCLLRQLISVLPMLLSAGLFTWIGTRFKRPVLSVFLFIFILSVPAVITNNFWWHPDSLTLLFLALVFFFLDRDELRCGKNFLLAAAACGAAVGTKYLGFYFALSIPAYLIFSLVHKHINWKTALIKALLFVLVMCLFILVSDPLLLLPQERAEIIRTMQQQVVLSDSGAFIKYQTEFLEDGHLPSYITEYYLQPWFLILLAIALFLGLFSKDQRRQSFALVVLFYFVLAVFININTAATRLHYFIPVILPLLVLLPDLNLNDRWSTNPAKVISLVFALVVCFQFGMNIKKDAELLDTQYYREGNSSSIKLYRELEENILPSLDLPDDRMTRVYRDWKMYFPEHEGYAVQTDWDMATYTMIEEWQPDIIILEKANIDEFAKDESLENAVDLQRMQSVHEFYLDAQNDEIKGYKQIGGNKIGTVFLKEEK